MWDRPPDGAVGAQPEDHGDIFGAGIEDHPRVGRGFVAVPFSAVGARVFENLDLRDVPEDPLGTSHRLNCRAGDLGSET